MYNILDFYHFETSLELLKWEIAEHRFQHQEGWRVYPLSRGEKEPVIGEINILNNILFECHCFDPIQHLQYHCSQEFSVTTKNKIHELVTDPIIILSFSSINSGHTLSEMMSFIDFYLKLNTPFKIGISSVIVDRLPFMYQLLTLFIPNERIVKLNSEITYHLKKAIFRRNRWFNQILDWSSISYKIEDNVMYLDDIRFLKNNFAENAINLLTKASDIYAEHSHKYQMYKNIFLVKTSDDPFACSSNRAMYISPEVYGIAKSNGFYFLKINDFKDIFEYICNIYHAENIVISYGSITCTNRFFMNSNANVILLAHLHYQKEYKSSSDFWHILHSHTCPVKNQKVMIDFPNEITEKNINDIFNSIEKINNNQTDDFSEYKSINVEFSIENSTIKGINIELLNFICTEKLENAIDSLGENSFDISNKKLSLQFHLVSLFKDSEIESIYLSIADTITIPLIAKCIASPYVGQKYPDIKWASMSRFVIDKVIDLPELFSNIKSLDLVVKTTDSDRKIGTIFINY